MLWLSIDRARSKVGAVAVGGRRNVRVAEQRSELKALEIPRPRSCIVWILVAKEKVLRLCEAEVLQIM
jgi:hypothetical protein